MSLKRQRAVKKYPESWEMKIKDRLNYPKQIDLKAYFYYHKYMIPPMRSY